MNTKLNKVVRSMSQISVPQEILSKIDINNLLQDFSDDYKKLDDLKTVRARHEDRNFVSRWWNSDELEDAQLDAAELQASFSKKLGQLMVISIAQSQQLNHQQNKLFEQQCTIKKQTEKLADNDDYLKRQQLSLEAQNTRLEKLINDYFELKDLTQEGALKLIRIASEVKETKDSLMLTFKNRMQEIDDISHHIITSQSELVSTQSQQLTLFKNEIQLCLDTHLHRVEEDIKNATQQLFQTDTELRQTMNITEENIAVRLSCAQEQQKKQQAEYDQHWKKDKAHVLDNLKQHQQDWMTEVATQYNRFESLQATSDNLQQQISEQTQLQLQQSETLQRIFESLSAEITQREKVWLQRWRLLAFTVTGVLTVLSLGLGYVAYTALL